MLKENKIEFYGSYYHDQSSVDYNNNFEVISYSRFEPEALYYTEDNNVEVQTARQEGKAEATQAIKKAQTASTPKVNATSSAPTKQGWDAQRVQQVIDAGNYDKYRDEILAWERTQY
jgi:predicted NAD-dependent protein-ADP-ribosyltransferase YbiA (DUF1768 family)